MSCISAFRPASKAINPVCRVSRTKARLVPATPAARQRRHALRNGHGRRQGGFRRIDQIGDETHGVGFRCSEAVAGQEITLRTLNADGLRPADDTAVARGESDDHMWIGDLGIPVGHADVAQRHQGCAEADGSTLNGRDDRDGNVDESMEYARRIARHAAPEVCRSAGGGDFVEVAARREYLACGREHDDGRPVAAANPGRAPR